MLSPADLRRVATDAGAGDVGFGRVERFLPELDTLLAHKEQGRSGPLHFTYDDPHRATEIKSAHPWARSIVSFLVPYAPGPASGADRGAIVARFAMTDSYAPVREVAGAISSAIEADGGRAAALIDDEGFLDRSAAVRSGIAWRGRSTMALTPRHGPWTLLGAVVTDIALPPDLPMRRTCGTCTACLGACPTGALDDHGLDARRCLATWLQAPGPIPHWIRPLLGRRIYGCDDCLTVCPPGFKDMADDGDAPVLEFAELLGCDDQALLERFTWWYIPGREPRHLRRNLVVAAGNSGEPEAVGVILEHLGHRSSLVRGHASWAVARSIGEEAVPTLEGALAAETEPGVREEILIALQMVEFEGLHAALLAFDEAERTAGYPGEVPRRQPVTPAVRAMRKAGIEFEAHVYDYEQHPGAMGAAEVIGVDPHLTVKTIVLETSNGDGVLVLMNGDLEISTKTLARALGVKSAKTASADKARRWTGYEFGGTSPFGTRTEMRLLAHKDVGELETIYVNAGSRGFVVGMKVDDLVAALSPTFANLAV